MTNKDTFKIRAHPQPPVPDAPPVSALQPVQSSVIRAVGYRVTSRTLMIEFVNGRVYRYADVPAYLYDDLMAAASAGRFYNRLIKPFYTGTAVES